MKKLALGFLLASLCLLSLAPASQAASPRIVGGSPATPGAWPSIAGVFPGPYLCGGTVIKSRWILTAAHCLEEMYPDETRVMTGSYDLFGADVPVADLVIHPSYSSYNLANDIALIRLQNATSAPAAQLPLSSERSLWEAGQSLQVAGWGTTCFETCPASRNLLQAEVQVVDFDQCDTAYENTLAGNQICAAAPGRDACQGDSGGPLEADSARGRVLVGIVSSGVGCADPEYPGIYTEVLPYLNWIGYNTVNRFSFSTKKINFGKRSGKRVVRITNRDQYSTDLRLSGARGFSFSPRRCRVAPGATCRVRVSFRSKGKPRTYKTKLLVRNGSGQPLGSVRLIGRKHR